MASKNKAMPKTQKAASQEGSGLLSAENCLDSNAALAEGDRPVGGDIAGVGCI
jgi:hypothetical protein